MLATRLLRYITIRNEIEVAELNRRANQCIHLGQYSEAKKSFIQALEKTKEDYGSYHPAYLASKCNLALINKYLGDYNQSIELYKEAYQGYVKSLGEEHKSTLIVLQNLGNA
jgi:tetratricopeptide (TPR) repeat protein